MEHTLMPMFAIPIYASQIEVTEDLKNLVTTQTYKRLNVENGFLSKNTRILDVNEFEDVKTEIIQHLNFLAYDLLKVESYINFELENSWLVKHKKGDWAQSHIHANSIFSGILYIDVDEVSGDLTFEKDRNHCNLFPPAIDLPVKERNVFNSKTWSFTPKNGDLFIFPSNLSHSVSTCLSDNVRYCLAFNAFPRGTLGLDIGEPLSVLSLR